MHLPCHRSAIAAMALLTLVSSALAAERAASARAALWLPDATALRVPPPAANAGDELRDARALITRRTVDDEARIRWWNVGGPAYRWNEIAVTTLLDEFVTLPLAARHLALVHAAIDDAVAIAAIEQRRYRRAAPSVADRRIVAVVPAARAGSYPSDHAAAAAAAATVLGYLFPERAASFTARADEAMRSRVLAGAEYPRDAEAGAALGRRVGEIAIARGKADGSDAKWGGSVPAGPGRWTGTNPIAPAAAQWQPWVLARPDELRPAPPPPVDSARTRDDLAELRGFARTPRANHRATYWEVFGGARAHALWNDLARAKLLEYGDAFDGRTSARALATLNIAFNDAAIACWDAKYAYWYPRPSQLDAELKPLFPPPNHPSYPAAHGCLSTAAAVVLAQLFPRDREAMLARGREAAEARIWAGIHYRFDIEAGQALGRQVAERVLMRAGVDVSP